MSVLEEGSINKNPAKGMKVTIPPPKQRVLTSEEADKLLREDKLCNHRFYPHWAVPLNVVVSIVGHKRIATTGVYNRLTGVGAKGSTNQLSYGLHFRTRGNNLVIPFVKK